MVSRAVDRSSMAQHVEPGRLRRRGLCPPLVLAVVGAALVTLTGPPAEARAAAAPGTLTTIAGGLGGGPATHVAQSPWGLTARHGRLVSVDSGFPLPPMGDDPPRPGLVRALDLATGNQTVLAGILTGGFRGDGGPATSAQLDFPTDAAIDAAGNVFITDTGNARVRKVTPAGTITTLAGNGVAGFSGDGGPATAASIDTPTGIAVAPSGAVAFADRRNRRVRSVSPSGTITTIAGTGAWTGPPVDGGPATAANLDPVGMEFDTAGNLYLFDRLHVSLRKIRVDGTITTVATPTFSGLFTVDGSGNLYVSANPGIVRIDPSGAFTTVAGGPEPAAPGEGNGDGGLAIDAPSFGFRDMAFDGGSLYLSDYHYRIRRIDGAGIITTVAGAGETNASGDGGHALDARFSTVSQVLSGPTGTYAYSGEVAVWPDSPPGIRRIDPSGVVSTIHQGLIQGFALDETGNVFFSWAYRIHRLTPSGVLTTVAGTGERGSTGDGGPATLARVTAGALAVDGAGNLYLYEIGRIRRVDPQGIITTAVGGSTDPHHLAITVGTESHVGAVADMAVDRDGSLFWTEWDTDGPKGWLTIRKLACGLVTHVTSDYGVRARGLAVDAAGSIYYTVDQEVVQTTLDGTRGSTVAGAGSALPQDGLPATSVALWYPSGLALHPSGGLLFGEDKRVRQVEGITRGRAVPGPACAGLPDRPVWGSGYNGFGQLGDGTNANRVLPSIVDPPLTRVTAVSGGYVHSLAVRDGSVWAWGWNAYGQLGDGTTEQRFRPVPVPGLSGVVAVSGGTYHSLALKADGTVWAWGWNGYGQLGDGTVGQRLTPVRVPGLTGVVAVSAGLLHNLALKADGSVWAWGWNGAGQLGDGTFADRRLPVRVPGLTGATGVAAGGIHSLAVGGDGSVWSWGWNAYGQLGDGTTTDRRQPGRVPGLAPAKGVAASWYHSLALETDGTVSAWGMGHVGQLGQTEGDLDSSTPVSVNSVTGAVTVAAGMFHSLALLADGRVMGWGWTYFGQLASPQDSGRLIPQLLHVGDHVTSIGAGAYDTLVAHRYG